MSKRIPLIELVVSNLRVYLREPEAIFWTYGFPLLMMVGLGIAFSSQPNRPVIVDVVAETGSEGIVETLSNAGNFEVGLMPLDKALERLRKNRTQVVLLAGRSGRVEYHFDPTNPESRVARDAVDNALQRAAGRRDPVANQDVLVTSPGSRYIDFLVPGLIGMNLMGGGLWGVGFVLVDMRVKHLLKRLLATPMKRRDLLLSMVGSRAIFFIPEATFLLLTAWLVFEVPIKGSLLAILLTAFIGSMSFAGIGLLVASRARRIETVSGLMNLVMMPMWLCSGIFFSSERFPSLMQPFIQALPLTQLNNSLRALILEGSPLYTQVVPILILVLWGGSCYLLALKWFRWT